MKYTELLDYYQFRGMKIPNTKEALDFAVTEIGEAMDSWIRENQTDWVRNNPSKETNLAFELADTYQMLEMACYAHCGSSLETVLLEKWASKGYHIPTRD